MFKAFICDFDGTLVATDMLIAEAEARSFAPYSSTEIDPKWIFNNLIGLAWTEKFEQIQQHYGLDLTEKSAEITKLRNRLKEQIHEGVTLEPFAHVVSVLTLLRKEGILGAVASNMETQESLEKAVASCGLKEIFNERYCSSGLAGHSKPHPAVLLRAAEALGCKPEECLFIGDAETDAQAAKNAGMAFALFTAGKEPEEQAPHADFYLRDYKELPSILRGERGISPS